MVAWLGPSLACLQILKLELQPAFHLAITHSVPGIIAHIAHEYTQLQSLNICMNMILYTVYEPQPTAPVVKAGHSGVR